MTLHRILLTLELHDKLQLSKKANVIVVVVVAVIAVAVAVVNVFVAVSCDLRLKLWNDTWRNMLWNIKNPPTLL